MESTVLIQNIHHIAMEFIVLIQVANTELSKHMKTFRLGISSEKATAPNLQRYQDLKNYWGLSGEKSIGAYCYIFMRYLY